MFNRLQLIALIVVFLVPSTVLCKGGHKISRPVTESISIEDEDEDNDRLELIVESDSYKYESTEYLAPMITYSSNGWDIGVSSQNILLSSNNTTGQSTAQNFQNDTYFNLNKTFRYGDVLTPISSKWSNRLSFISTTFGTQTGMVLPMSTSADPGKLNSSTIHLFDFIDNDFEIIKNRFTVHGGPYWSNAALTTTTTYVGWQTGTEVVIIPKTLRITADFFSGHSNVSGGVYDVVYMINKNIELFVGVGIPTANSGNYPYAILGFNLIKIFDNTK